MKRLNILIALLMAAALTACGDSSDVFYTTTYPVVRVEVSVSLTEEPETPDPETPDPETPDPETPDPETPDPENPGTGTSDAEEPEEPENPLIREIRDDVLAKAPVQSGGSYRLDFTMHNGGLLVVRATADAEPVTGTFNKEPDKPEQLVFEFGGQTDSCKVSSYTDTDNVRKTLLTVDLTEEYQKAYPDAGVTQVIRQEYTSHRY